MNGCRDMTRQLDAVADTYLGDVTVDANRLAG
jgi:hypothetical protein